MNITPPPHHPHHRLLRHPTYPIPRNVDNQGVETKKEPRSSNLELYRIICMLMIVAHHYVTNSGLTGQGEPLMTDFTSGNSIFLTLFGAWGKTGINCFMMITGYFMCTSKITLRKFLKLLLQVYLYHWLFYIIFLVAGYETLSVIRLIQIAMPVWGVTDNFVSCFIGFYLTIPFLTILVKNLNQRQHQLLLFLALGIYTMLGSIPIFDISFNYITWFGIIFLIASYIRLYPCKLFENRKLWGWLTLLFFVLGSLSVVLLRLFVGEPAGMGYSFVADSNRIFAVTIAVSSFLWFKNMKIRYNKRINAIGAATFGVLLIHANSSAMRTWLWKDTLDVVGHYTLPFGTLMLYSIAVVLIIFVVCNLIDQLRIATVEKWFFNWYDNKFSAKADAFVNKVIQKQ